MKKSWQTTLVGIIAGVLFILTILALVFDKIELPEFSAINASIAVSATVILGIITKYKNATHSDYYKNKIKGNPPEDDEEDNPG